MTDEAYFEDLEAGLEDALSVAQRAREKGFDPEPEVEIPTARDMADRVEKVLGIDGVAERVRELEDEMSREEAALELVKDFVDGEVGEFETDAGKIEGAVRTAVALLTEGVVAAPIEGIDRVELLENDDGTEFVNVYYAGPIRSAGGTAQALSVLVADYARSLLGVEEYGARTEETERYAEEVALYDKETGLQYSPKDEETKFIAKHMPIMLDGEATGDEEVSGFRDLERVDTNNPRGGMCLVLAEGIALKAPKIQRYTRNLDEVEWPWLQDLIDGTYAEDASDEGDDAEEDASDEGDDAEEDDEDSGGGPPRVDPSKKFLRDLIAGRPVFGHPSESGGFRLRYGRARNHGFATAGVHPATMRLVDDFLAAGTQIKTERPGKAAGVVPVDSIEGPTVRLANGDVRRIDDPGEALEVRNGVEAILDLGEYLVNYGEFVENNHPLAPASYTVEWWIQEFERTAGDVQAFRDDPSVDLDHPSPAEALAWAREYDAPLHPDYTYTWHDIDVADLDHLADALAEGRVVAGDGNEGDGELLVRDGDQTRRVLERLLVEHTQATGPDEEWIRIPTWRPLAISAGLDDRERTWTLPDLSEEAREWDNAMRAVEEVAPFEVRERAPTRIGNRMGRPEKSEERELTPAVHALFPIGEAGGNQRDVAAAADYREEGGRGDVEVEVGRRVCGDCGTETFKSACPDCGGHTEPRYECPDCGQVVEFDEAGRVRCSHCEVEATAVEPRVVDVHEEYRDALEAVGERENAFDVLKGVKGLTSTVKTPEPLAKGVLRAKHDVSAFKDGTVRYDMTDLPVTSVRPEELGITAGQLRELGYDTDIRGDPLRHDDQLVELKVQDVILSNGGAQHMIQTADFVDDLLTQFYGLEPYYELDDRDDLVGELVFGMAPHTSAAVVGRVVGFTGAAVGYAHPYFHASKRRNCFHPDTKIWFEGGEGWNYGRIEEFVEFRLDEERAERDDFGTFVDELSPGDRPHVPSIGDDGEQHRKPVTAVSKHPAPDHLVEITTAGGREIAVTPDHRMQVHGEDGIETRQACELDESDRLVTPDHLDAVDPSPDPPRFDLLAEFLRVDEIDSDRLTIKGLDKDDLYELFEQKLADGDDFRALYDTADYLGIDRKTFSNYLYRESIPAGVLLEVFDSVDELLAFVPDDVSLGMKRDRTEMDRIVEVDERVATLLGYYAAEGFAREQETPKGTVHQTTICGTEAEARQFFFDAFESGFGVAPYDENDAKITVSGRLPRVFFDTVLDAGVLAHTKRVPQCIFDAPDRIVGAFLGGYVSGDGSIDDSAPRVRTTTVSPQLKEDVLALLTRLGIDATVDSTDPVSLHENFPEYDDEGTEETARRCYRIAVSSGDAVRFEELSEDHLSRKSDQLRETVESTTVRGRRIRDGGTDVFSTEPIESVEYVESDTEWTYCLTVSDTHSLVANDLSVAQCDGDEDCVMLLMDGLLNFSRQYLPDQRGGRMDAPLVMSSRIDPGEIDDEAHNVDIVEQYPLELYEASREMAYPEEVDVEIGEDRLDSDRPMSGFGHTHDTARIDAGPDLSAYKTLGDMEEKMNAQLELARKLRAVDETDVAERVIEYHFLPDLIGNLRAFSQQEVRCLDCGKKYRRPPLSEDCRECGGRVNLTVHEGSVTKYLETASRIAEEYGARTYTKQRIEVLEIAIERTFENDHNKQSGIADFM